MVFLRRDGSRETALILAPAAGLDLVEFLARLQLDLRREGDRLIVDSPAQPLRELLQLVGLRAQLIGEAEDREQLVGLEEGVDARDPIAGQLDHHQRPGPEATFW